MSALDHVDLATLPVQAIWIIDQPNCAPPSAVPVRALPPLARRFGDRRERAMPWRSQHLRQ